MADQIYTLMVSCNTDGRYALDEPDGPEISSGQPLAIQISSVWIEGSVEYGEHRYVNPVDPNPRDRTLSGYYFLARGGGVCGLCTGMRVRLL
jgi:hypothetical protein